MPRWALALGSCIGVAAIVLLVLPLGPIATVIVAALVLVIPLAINRPESAALLLTTLTVAFPKAGIKVGDFPFPVFLFGMIVAITILYAKRPRTPLNRWLPLVLVGYVAIVLARALVAAEYSATATFGLLAWAALPIILFFLSTQLTTSADQLRRFAYYGFIIAGVYGLLQVAFGVDAIAIQGLTFASGDDLSAKNNTIFADDGTTSTKIPSTYQAGNIFGMVSVLFLAVGLLQVVQRRASARIDLVVCALALISIGTSGSRTAIIAAFVAIAIILVKFGRIGQIVGAAFGFVAIATVLVILQPALVRRYSFDLAFSDGGSGRTTLWAEALRHLSPLEILFGMNVWQFQTEGWVGAIQQLGLVPLLVLCGIAVALSRRRFEKNVVLAVLLVGLIIDSSYLLFPTWFIPSLLVAGSAGVATSSSRKTGSTELIEPQEALTNSTTLRARALSR